MQLSLVENEQETLFNPWPQQKVHLQLFGSVYMPLCFLSYLKSKAKSTD